jgi:hypothetical protein
MAEAKCYSESGRLPVTQISQLLLGYLHSPLFLPLQYYMGNFFVEIGHRHMTARNWLAY